MPFARGASLYAMPAAIVNCDWGTSRLRLRTVRTEPWQVTTEYRSLDGVAAIAEMHPAVDRPAGYRSLLFDALQPLISEQPELLAGAPILISGMASSSIGWYELPYAKLPLPLDGSGLSWQELPPLESRLGLHRVYLISGVCSETDVMRGEETELVGLFSTPAGVRLAENGLVIKPGTHSKHLRIVDGQLTSFQTFMSGELFDVLSKHSILQYSVSTERESQQETQHGLEAADDLAAFLAGVRQALAMPMSSALFQVRTRQLLAGNSGESNRSFLSGVLLGAELGYLKDAAHADVNLALCATEPLAPHYINALAEVGVRDRLLVIPPAETEMLSARGQTVIWRQIAGA
jgi:2-dehydro-3-deoxygalactonokinase